MIILCNYRRITYILLLQVFLLFLIYQWLAYPNEVKMVGITHLRSHDKFLLWNVMPYLGFNNVRYDIELHLYFALLLNRTLILPSYIHMRECFQPGICRIQAYHVHNESDIDDPWAMPIEHFYDIKYMQSKCKVLKFDEFVELQKMKYANISELLKGDDIISDMKRFQDILPDSFFTKDMYSYLYDQPHGTLVIDDAKPIIDKFELSNSTIKHNIWGFQRTAHMAIDQSFSTTIDVLPPHLWKDRGSIPYQDPLEVDIQPDRFSRKLYSEHYQSPVSIVGLLQDWKEYNNVTFLHLDGDPHIFGRQPLRFSSESGKNYYEMCVLQYIRYSPEVFNAYNYVKNRLEIKLNNRPYVGIHIRRGDFLRLGWVGELDNTDILIEAIERGLKKVHKLYEKNKPSDTPNPSSRVGLSNYWILSTDDRNISLLNRFSTIGGLSLFDILAEDPDVKKNFYDKYYHLVNFGDWMGLIEQLILADSYFFIGMQTSSFSGGVFNLRASLGKSDWNSGYMGELCDDSDWEYLIDPKWRKNISDKA
jgi:hypothetical protein